MDRGGMAVQNLYDIRGVESFLCHCLSRTELRKLALLFEWQHCIRQASCIVDYKEIFGASLFELHPKNRKAKKSEKKLMETIYCINFVSRISFFLLLQLLEFNFVQVKKKDKDINIGM